MNSPEPGVRLETCLVGRRAGSYYIIYRHGSEPAGKLAAPTKDTLCLLSSAASMAKRSPFLFFPLEFVFNICIGCFFPPLQQACLCHQYIYNSKFIALVFHVHCSQSIYRLVICPPVCLSSCHLLITLLSFCLSVFFR